MLFPLYRFPQYIKKRLLLQRAAFYNRNTVVELHWGALADPAIIVLRKRNADELCRKLIFSEIDEDTLLLEDKPFFLKFGTPFDEVEEKLKSIGISFFDVEEVEKGDDSAIDNLINSINEDEEEDDDNFDDDNF